MRFLSPIAAAALVVLTFGGTPVSAQAPVYGAAPDPGSRPIAGWMFVPSLGYSGVWDDNALVRGHGDTTPDYASTLNPRALLDYTSRRTQFISTYDGSFVAYRDLNALNSFDQRANVSARRLMAPHFAVFTRGSLGSSPTTELLELVAVPFVRLGSRVADLKSGVEMAFTKRTSITASYNLQWVDFDHDPVLGLELLGGHSQGASASLHHQISERTSLVATYDTQRATVLGGTHFNLQAGDAGVELKPTPSVRIVAALGAARLDVKDFAEPRTGLSWRSGLTRRFGENLFDVGYNRSFVPSYSFGGTSQNEEFQTSLSMPFGRRWYTRSAFSWRRNEPLTPNDLRLKSTWFDGTVGYTVRTWMQVEGFYSGTHQAIDRPGGLLDRNRVGFQVITAKRMRIR